MSTHFDPKYNPVVFFGGLVILAVIGYWLAMPAPVVAPIESGPITSEPAVVPPTPGVFTPPVTTPSPSMPQPESDIARTATLEGEYTCLPPKDKEGMHTLECAFGLMTDNGLYYAIDMSGIQTFAAIDIATGSRVRVTGILVPVEALSSIQKYDIKGIIRATMMIEVLKR